VVLNVDTKVRHRSEVPKDAHKEASVGLSYSPYLGNEFRIHVQRFNTGETVLRASEIIPNEAQRQFIAPPINEGQRVQNGLSRRGKTRLRRAASYYQLLVMANLTTKAYCSMLTLTYGMEYPKDEISKKDLDNFFHRMRGYFGKTFHYVWVAERQKRGAIHFHILTPEYVPKKWLNQKWNEVVSNRLTKEGKEDSIQVLYPNVKAVNSAGAYMVKYCQKQGENIIGNGYSISHKTSAELKPIFEQCYDLHGVHLDEILGSVEASATKYAHVIETSPQSSGNRFMWLSDTNSYAFSETINYLLEGNQSMKPILKKNNENKV
jgi:hypothetical protein